MVRIYLDAGATLLSKLMASQVAGDAVGRAADLVLRATDSWTAVDDAARVAGAALIERQHIVDPVGEVEMSIPLTH
jgi:hypothetical protein